MNALRQLVAGNPRMGSALLGSVLLHLLMLFAVSLQFNAWKPRRVAPSDFEHPLQARIVASAPREEREVPSTPPQASAPAPAPEERPGPVLARPGPGMEKPAEAPKAQSLPAQPVQLKANGEPGPPFGVRVRETLFTRPYPRQFIEENPLLSGQGFVRDIDLEERPRALTLVIPEYPPSVLAKSTEGWVTVAFFLDEKGEIVHAWPVESSEEIKPFQFDLMAALRRSTFTPGKLKGKAVKSITFQTLRFNPEGWSDPKSPQEAPPAPRGQ
jgi:outer membrane biosynthesis protein TonB